MDELLDIWDENGRPTGRRALKSEAHRQGWYHPTVHIWFYTTDGRVLLQLRAADKDTFAGLWDVSVAGHIGAGESQLEGALREIGEEIGLEAKGRDLEFITVHKQSHTHPNGIVDSEFRHVYVCLLRKPLRELTPQASEVAQLKLQPLMTFAEEVWGLARPGIYVPHGTDYYQTVIKAIRSRL